MQLVECVVSNGLVEFLTLVGNISGLQPTLWYLLLSRGRAVPSSNALVPTIPCLVG